MLRPLVKRKSLQFKNLLRINRNKISRQTLVSYLQKATELGIVNRVAEGRNTFYSLNVEISEIETLRAWLSITNEKLSYLPIEFKQC